MRSTRAISDKLLATIFMTDPLLHFWSILKQKEANTKVRRTSSMTLMFPRKSVENSIAAMLYGRLFGSSDRMLYPRTYLTLKRGLRFKLTDLWFARVM